MSFIKYIKEGNLEEVKDFLKENPHIESYRVENTDWRTVIQRL
jgi:hypothetical protein